MKSVSSHSYSDPGKVQRSTMEATTLRHLPTEYEPSVKIMRFIEAHGIVYQSSGQHLESCISIGIILRVSVWFDHARTAEDLRLNGRQSFAAYEFNQCPPFRCCYHTQDSSTQILITTMTA